MWIRTACRPIVSAHRDKIHRHGSVADVEADSHICQCCVRHIGGVRHRLHVAGGGVYGGGYSDMVFGLLYIA